MANKAKFLALSEEFFAEAESLNARCFSTRPELISAGMPNGGKSSAATIESFKCGSAFFKEFAVEPERKDLDSDRLSEELLLERDDAE